MIRTAGGWARQYLTGPALRTLVCMNPFEVQIPPSLAEALASLPPSVEQAVRSHLRDIARAAADAPAPFDGEWTGRPGLELKHFRFEIADYRIVYELDPRARAVVLHAVSRRQTNAVRDRTAPPFDSDARTELAN